eukprot:4099597-Alexandrium_andersonii.AAC.1
MRCASEDCSVGILRCFLGHSSWPERTFLAHLARWAERAKPSPPSPPSGANVCWVHPTTQLVPPVPVASPGGLPP